jgi:hypothetical protein
MNVALGVRIAFAWASFSGSRGPRRPLRCSTSAGSTSPTVARRQSITTPVQPVWLANVGDAPLTIATIAITGTYAGQFAWSGTCAPSAILGPGDRCRIDTTLTPTGLLPTLRAATLSVTTSASPTPVSIALSATLDNGRPQSPFQAVPTDPSPDWIDFGAQRWVRRPPRRPSTSSTPET